MRINEKGTNLEITGRIREYLYKKLEHLEKFVDTRDDSALLDVELGKTTNHHKSGEIFRTEVNLQVKGKNFRAVAEEEDLFTSIDIAKDDMVRQLQVSKDRRLSFVRRGGARVKNLIKGVFSKND